MIPRTLEYFKLFVYKYSKGFVASTTFYMASLYLAELTKTWPV